LLLLIPTTSYRASDFLDAAERLGVAVTVGSDQASVLQQFDPAGTLEVAFNDPDRAVRQIADFHASYPLAAIVGVDEGTATIAARASAELGLPHNDPVAVAAASDKYRFRQTLSTAGVVQPTYRLFAADDDPPACARQINAYPVVLKPLSLAASRGVLRADDPEQFARAFERIRRILAATREETGLSAAPYVLAEEYLPGGEVALDGLLIDGRLHTIALFDKPEPMEGPTFEETIFLTPSSLSAEVQAQVIDRTQESIKALGLTDGPIHAELRLTQELGPVPLELAARSIGGLCARILRYGAGLSLEEVIVAHALGRDPAELKRVSRPSGVMMLPVPREGTLQAVDNRGAALAVPGILDLQITVAPGTYVRPLPEGDRYLGFLFAQGDSAEDVRHALGDASAALDIRIA
jgi:biotin carboxylase